MKRSNIPDELLPNNIRRFREERKMSQEALGKLANTTGQQIDRLEKGDRKLTTDWMVRIGEALGVDPKHLMRARSETINKTERDSRHFRPASSPPSGAVAVEFGKPDLPVYGLAQGGVGDLIIPVEQRPIAWVIRPPQLEGITEAFAIFATGDSMAPMFRSGQVLYIHPHLPPIPGEGVLIVKEDDHAIFKEYVRLTDGSLIVKEYRPEEREFAIPRAEIRSIFRIVGAMRL